MTKPPKQQDGKCLLSERFDRALGMAHRLHGSQKRKGCDVPYIAHLLAVAAIVLEAGGDENTAIAALLHDAVEDQGGQATLAEIRKEFGDEVAEIVMGCTDSDTIPKPPWRERKEKYIEHIRRAPWKVRLVSSADKLHNARAILADYREVGEALWPRFQGGKDKTLWYYRALIEAFREAGTQPVVEELARTFEELEKLVTAKTQSSAG
jgi:GTP pyrophosphokinase